MKFLKPIFVLAITLFLVTSCKSESSQKTEETVPTENTKDIAYASFGKEIIDDDALSVDRVTQHYQAMAMGDSINMKFKTNVNEVCQAKGCWMKAQLLGGEEVMVKFKDYGFFVPKDISGKEIVVNGIAFVNEVSVDEQRHYAEDEGLSEDEIASITQPKKTYSFLADGVLVKED